MTRPLGWNCEGARMILVEFASAAVVLCLLVAAFYVLEVPSHPWWKSLLGGALIGLSLHLWSVRRSRPERKGGA